MATLRYVSHPAVVIDPDVPVPNWGITAAAKERVHMMCQQPWIPSVRRIISSAETKAFETASIVGLVLGLDVEVRPATGETDRSSTGYVSHDRHEELANEMFAFPEKRASGWERAIDVQARVLHALDDVLSSTEDVLVVGHGGAGTLLYCALAGVAINRAADQQRAGSYFAVDLATRTPLHPWRLIDDLESP